MKYQVITHIGLGGGRFVEQGAIIDTENTTDLLRDFIESEVEAGSNFVIPMDNVTVHHTHKPATKYVAPVDVPVEATETPFADEEEVVADTDSEAEKKPRKKAKTAEEFI